MSSSCPFCLSMSVSHSLKSYDYFLSKESFDIFKCDACGLIYTDGAPSREDMGRYYESDEYYSHNNSSSFMGRIYSLARSVMLRRKGSIITDLCSGGDRSPSILDIGCGTGYFLNEMSRRGWLVSGYEESISAVKFGVDTFSLDIKQASRLMDESKSFDVITLWHVLEHVDNPDVYMRKITEILNSGGYLVLALPNPLSYDARKYGEFWGAYDVPRHLWHFTPSFIESFVKGYGFRLIETKSMLLDGFYVSLLSERYRGGSPLRALALAFVGMLRTLFVKRNEASSLIYIFRAVD